MCFRRSLEWSESTIVWIDVAYKLTIVDEMQIVSKINKGISRKATFNSIF